MRVKRQNGAEGESHGKSIGKGEEEKRGKEEEGERTRERK